MKKGGDTPGRYLMEMFQNTHDQKILDAINIRNIHNVSAFAVIVCVFDTLSLVLFAATKQGEPRFWQTVFNVGCCVIVCVLVIILSRASIRRFEKDGVISNWKTNALVAILYIALSAWGIMVDSEHYMAGEQMLTFYIVQFCFVSFVVMPVKAGSAMIALAFSALYLRMYLIDGAAKMQPQNHFIFLIIALFGSAMQHMMLLETEKQKTEILELNEILRQQALIDDLTKLRNRNALRVDFERYAGRDTCVVMADVDHFKAFNDSYGHPVGDSVLRLVADAAMEAFQGGGTYRYGGDEFLILLSDHTEEEFAEELRQWKQNVAAIQIPNVTRKISCSCGYERCLLKNPEDLRNAIKTADARMYEAKKTRAENALPW